MIRLMDWCGFSAVNIRGVGGDVTNESSLPLVNIWKGVERKQQQKEGIKTLFLFSIMRINDCFFFLFFFKVFFKALLQTNPYTVYCNNVVLNLDHLNSVFLKREAF